MNNWIKVSTNLHEKPEVMKLSALLNMDIFAVTGRLQRLWGWFDQFTTDGIMSQSFVTDVTLDELVCHTGFCDALEKVGWLSISGGSLTIPNFDLHNGESAKKRLEAANRKRLQRFREKKESKKPSQKRVTDVTKETGPEKRREDKSTSTPQSPPRGDRGFSDDFDFDESQKLERIQTQVRALKPEWSKPFTDPERRNLMGANGHFDDYDFDLVRKWLESNPSKPPTHRGRFLGNGGASTLERAQAWNRKRSKRQKQKSKQEAREAVGDYF